MAFSAAGLGVALAVLLPNLLLVAFRPRDGFLRVKVPMVFAVLERAGQIACIGAAAITPVFIDPWCIAGALCLLGYYGLWGRYLAKGRTFALLYVPLGPLPIPMAVLPVLTFLLVAVSGRSLWLGLASVVLAVGHWVTSALVARAISTR